MSGCLIFPVKGTHYGWICPRGNLEFETQTPGDPTQKVNDVGPRLKLSVGRPWMPKTSIQVVCALPITPCQYACPLPSFYCECLNKVRFSQYNWKHCFQHSIAVVLLVHLFGGDKYWLKIPLEYFTKEDQSIGFCWTSTL